MSSVWILGRSGLLGSALARASGDHQYIPQEAFAWTDPAALRGQLERAVTEFAAKADGGWQIHWAAGTGTMGSTEAELAAETEALKTLLGFIGNTPALQKNGILTFASSAGAVYAGSKDDIITEDSAPAPLNAYGREKLKQEELLRAFSASHPGLRILIARMSNLYGAGQSRSKKQGLLSHIARCILLRKPINIFVPFDTIRDYIPADDAAALLLEICDRLGSAPFTVKIIASESPVTVAQIIGTFKYVTRVAPRVITSTGAIAKSYTHRMVFKSTAKPIVGHRKTSLLIGVSRVMADEKMKLMTV